jgi:hypothetical protein
MHHHHPLAPDTRRSAASRGSTDAVTPESAERGGGAWLGSLLLGPFLGYLVGSTMVAHWSERGWAVRSAVWILLGAVLPVSAALWHARSLRAAGQSATGVVIISVLVSGFAWPAARRLAVGPRLETVTLASRRCETVGTWRGRVSTCVTYRHGFADGRSFVGDALLDSQQLAGRRASVLLIDDTILAMRLLPGEDGR